MFRIYYFIKRVIAYLPLLWKDQDWDSVYLLDMMKFKLSRMRKLHERAISNRGWWGENSPKAIKQMRTCEILLERMGEQAYGRMAELHSRVDIVSYMQYCDYMYKQDAELFCKIFKKYHENWWD